jgi:hypothetical protein
MAGQCVHPGFTGVGTAGQHVSQNDSTMSGLRDYVGMSVREPPAQVSGHNRRIQDKRSRNQNNLHTSTSVGVWNAAVRGVNGGVALV